MLEIFSSCHKTIGSTNNEFQEPLSGGYLYVVCVCVCECVSNLYGDQATHRATV